MDLFFWRKPIRPRITVKVGDVLTIEEFGREERIRITGLIDNFVYYCYLTYGHEHVMTHSELRASIVDRSKIRTQIEI